mmetsp:Transcript_509/g.977  ORF Transcript_509/g.977 Transcript_509/m.977 type:complete len:220 (-) Transcript_509:124-783(-)
MNQRTRKVNVRPSQGATGYSARYPTPYPAEQQPEYSVPHESYWMNDSALPTPQILGAYPSNAIQNPIAQMAPVAAMATKLYFGPEPPVPEMTNAPQDTKELFDSLGMGGLSGPAPVLQGQSPELAQPPPIPLNAGQAMAPKVVDANTRRQLKPQPKKMFRCNFCRKDFRCKYGIKRHLRSHTGERPYPCDMCDRAFRQKAHLAGHIRARHSNGHVERKS